MIWSQSEAQTNPLGVMHNAIIVTPDAAQRRVVNSTMLVTEGAETAAAGIFGSR
jgi:hypothetical protein